MELAEEYGSKNRHTDFQWFVQCHQELYEKYGHCFLAVRNRKVVDVGDSYASVLEEGLLTNQIGTFIVQECTYDESSYTAYLI